MTVTAPPRPPQPSDPAQHDDPEALIEEARQRQRRRRRRYAAAAALVMLIAASLSIVLGRTEPSLRRDAQPPPPQAAAADHDEAATLIAHHFVFHQAYVLIYDDGRAIVGAWGPSYERHLTPAGIELLRAGAIDAPAVLEDILRTDLDRPRNSRGEQVVLNSVSASSQSSLPAGTWADAEYTRYEPTRYAVCPDAVDLNTALRIADRRNPAAAAFLHGHERTYENVDVLYDDQEPATGRCFDLSADEFSALRTALIEAGYPEPSTVLYPDTNPQYFPFADAIDFHVYPNFPHGEPVGFYG